MKQKDVFLGGEGDAWYERNRSAGVSRNLEETDRLLAELVDLSRDMDTEGADVLEIGCGEALRLAWLKERLGWRCRGIDPSARAVEAAARRGISVQQGTADVLPFGDGAFNFVIFGFCLYVCDRQDLFRIACEADRVLRRPGWLLILDFHSRAPYLRPYHHKAGVFTHKMDFSTLFTWHPDYILYSHKVRHHSNARHTDDASEWTAVSVLRKLKDQDG